MCSDVQTVLLEEENHPVKRLAIISCFGETDVDAMAAGLVQNAEDPIQIVPIHLHHWLAGILAFEQVSSSVRERYLFIGYSEKPAAERCLRSPGTREVHYPNAISH